MFKEAVYSTALNTDIANESLSNIRGAGFRCNGETDNTFVSTLRALLHNRVQGEVVELLFIRTRDTPSSIGDASNTLYIYHQSEAGAELVFPDLTDRGFQKIQKITEFFRKSFRVECWVKPNTKTVIVFTEVLNFQRLHYLQCATFAMFPWWFEDKKVEPLEMELIESLRCKDSTTYLAVLEKFANGFNFREERIRRCLSGFETKIEQRKLESVRREIDNYDASIRDLQRKISDYIVKQRELKATQRGLIAAIEDGSSDELMSYFIRNKKVSIDSVDTDSVTFIVSDYIDIYVEDELEGALNNPRSWIYKPGGVDKSGKIPPSEIKKFYEAVFIDRLVKMRTCARFRMKLTSGIDPISERGFDGNFSTFMPNPHIQRFACMGDYRDIAAQLAVAGDYVGAIENCIASTKTLNFHDDCVMETLSRAIYGEEISHIHSHCFELPDGTVTDPLGVLKWLKEKEDDNG